MNNTTSASTVTMLIFILTSCFSPMEKKMSDKGIHVVLKVKDISNTKLKFVTRGVGLEKTKGFQIMMRVENRKSIVVYERLHMKLKPKKEYLNDVLSTFEMKVSPNKKHFAISYIDNTKKTFMYHLLTKGEPFSIDKYNQRIQKKELQDINWKNIPSPKKLAKNFVISGIKDVSYYSIKNQYLWDAISANMPNDDFNELIVRCWPNVYEAKNMVNSIMEKTTNYNNSFFKSLEKKAKQVLITDTLNSNIINAIFVGYKLGGEQLHATVFEKLLPIWPESPTLLKFVSKYFREFPIEIQDKIIAKSLIYSKKNKGQYYNTLNKEFLREFADSLKLTSLNI